MRELPIGFIDSGYGGLTVVKQSLKQLPNESILYFGDNARAPYGPRSLNEVKRYIWQMTNFLREQGIKMLVIACNTGSAAALEEIRASLAIPVVGVIHSGSRAAIKRSNNQKIGIIGTQGTIRSQLYEKVILDKVSNIKLTSLACPQFVEIVESQKYSSQEAQEIIARDLAPLQGRDIDTLVLGCTHYPILKKEIGQVMGEEVTLIDSGAETINEVSILLDYFNLSRTAEEARQEPRTEVYYTTAEPQKFVKVAEDWLQKNHLLVKGCQIKGEIIVENHYSDTESREA